MSSQFLLLIESDYKSEFLLVKHAHTEVLVVLLLEFQSSRTQIMGCYIHSNSVPGYILHRR